MEAGNDNWAFSQPQTHGCHPVGKCTCGRGPYCPTCGYCSYCGGKKSGQAVTEPNTKLCEGCGAMMVLPKGRGRPRKFCDACKAN